VSIPNPADISIPHPRHSPGVPICSQPAKSPLTPPSVLENGPWQEQSNNFYTASPLTAFCDRVEGVQAGALQVPTSTGVGVAKALEGYAYWIREVYVPKTCQTYGYTDPLSIECFDTYNPENKMYTDHTVENANGFRQWQWMLCNEPFGWWQT
jgi:hypothetical protein